MPFEIRCGDITKVQADAVVNAANSSLLGGGGVDGAIHRAAGSGLLEECRKLGGCKVGEAKLTKGYALPAGHVIHTVGPIWRGGQNNEAKLLRACYDNSLALAKDNAFSSIAFPLISSGAFGYPKDLALQVAVSAIGDFLLENELQVYLVLFERKSLLLPRALSSALVRYLDENYRKEPDDLTMSSSKLPAVIREDRQEFLQASPFAGVYGAIGQAVPLELKKRRLEDVVQQLEETFSQSLLRLIDDKGLTDTETYKRANIDRKLFSKIRNNAGYKPSKATALAFAIALRLNMDETKDLLLKAGFALSCSSKFDMIVRYFIEDGNYDIFEINEALFAFEENMLGS